MPNIGNPLFDSSLVASSCRTSQCSASTVGDAKNIRSDPIHRLAEARESPVNDHEISLRHDRSRFVLQRWRDALDQIEQSIATRFDMSAVLDVVGRAIPFSRLIVPLVKQCIECLREPAPCFVLPLTQPCFCS